MKISLKITLWSVLALSLLLLSGCFQASDNNTMQGMDHSNMEGMNSPGMSPDNSSQKPDTSPPAVQTAKVQTIRETKFTLTAQESNLEVQSGKFLPVWTFNNSVPGPEIRVKQGDTVSITLQNKLPDPVTIHWHGVPVPNDMDGIPGVTQNAVQPGKSFTYTFKADVPGTYWYHSHQDSVNQVDMGLYGAFIVEPKDNPVNKDYALVLDEWISSGPMKMDMGNTETMDHSSMNMDTSDNSKETGDAKTGMSMEMGDDMSMYDLYTINGKSGSLVDPLPVKQGDKVRIRLINAGFISHQIHLHGHEFKITATDGQPINQPSLLKDTLVSIAPGERYDIEFEANNPGNWYLEEHGDKPAVKGMKAQIQYEGAAAGSDQPNDAIQLPVVDITNYGQPKQAKFTLDQKYTQEYTMNLNTEMKNGQTVYTINGKTFPDTEPIKVNKGDTVKVRFVNKSKTEDHPMHLHGHFFQVLSKDGTPTEGSPIWKDTLNVKPGEEYVVAFEADNPGNWMFHCHDLHHASAGMVTELQYNGYTPDFTLDPKAGNKPE